MVSAMEAKPAVVTVTQRFEAPAERVFDPRVGGAERTQMGWTRILEAQYRTLTAV